MFLVTLLSCQAFASDSTWKGEADLRASENGFEPILVKARIPADEEPQVTSWTAPKGTSCDEDGCIDHIQERLRVTFKSAKITTKEVNGGTWICGTLDDLDFSAFMHPTKNHSVGIDCGKIGKVLPENPVNAEPGVWAIVFGNATSCNWKKPVSWIIE